MPRKPRAPLINLQIERLSDGINPYLKDDWTGKVLPQPDAKPPPDLRAEQGKRKQAEREAKVEMLNKLGITHSGYTEPAKPQMPKHNEVFTESGLVLSVARPRNAIKRRF